MSRAVIMATNGDPFLLEFWMKYFKEVWSDEIDKLYVHLNGVVEESVVEYLKKVFDHPKVYLKWSVEPGQPGDYINEILDEVEEDYVLLIEDDVVIFKKGVIDEHFKVVENGEADVVGTKAGSCTLEITERAKMRFPAEVDENQRHNISPGLCFTKKETLLKTDRIFRPRTWIRGEHLEALDWIVDIDRADGDTLVNISLQLRNLGLKILYVRVNHSRPDDAQNYISKMYLFDGKASWVHFGSLSTGFGGALLDSQGRALGRRTTQVEGSLELPQSWCTTEHERIEWEHRVRCWQSFWENAQRTGLKEMHELYGIAIERIIIQFGLDRKRILHLQKIYEEMMTSGRQ